jgi:SAM-dependent methyltransferase
MESGYFGLFDRVLKNYPDIFEHVPFYHDRTVELYDRMMQAEDDYRVFVEQVRHYGGPVLELCSGSGRLTIPVLRQNVDVTAVDLSEDMLRSLREKLKGGSPGKYREHLEIVRADMMNLSLDQRYSLIIIGATSIRLVEGDFASFFDSMYRLLLPGGELFFDFEDIPIPEGETEKLEPMAAVDLPNQDNSFQMILFQRLLSYREKRGYFNLMELDIGSRERQLISRTEYRIFGKDEIVEGAERSRFGFCRILPKFGSMYYCSMIKNENAVE